MKRHGHDSFFMRQATSVAIATITVLMVLAAALYYAQGQKSNNDEMLLMHTYQVTGHIQLLFNRIKDVELGQRGYIIEGKEEYLAPYYDAQKNSLGADAKSTQLEQHHSVAEELSILRTLMQDNPMQQQNLDELDNYIKDLIDYWGTTIKLRREQGKAMISTFDFSRGKQMMDDLRRLVGIMMAEENRLLSERIVADAASTKEHDLLTFIGMGVFYVIMVASVWMYQRARKQAAADQLQLIDLIEESSDYIGMADLEGNLLYHNRSAMRMVGLPDDQDLSQMKIAEMHPAWAAKFVLEQGVPATYATGSWQGETALLHRDGHEIPVLQNLALHRDAEGNPVCFTTIIRDITERKKEEQQRESLIEKLAESNTELERFAYVASHDMQEPLRMIASFGALLRKEYSGKLDDEGQEYVHIVTESAIRMQHMVNDLLEYARVGNDGVRFALVHCEDEANHVLENLSSAIRERGARVVCDSLPDIWGNAVQFMRLLQNLIGNGLKYQRDGVTPQVHVHVQVQDEGDHWLFSVADNGIGMPEEYLTQIFEPYKRLHTWEEFKGTGIGLAVCKKIVENHGGKIWATSHPGEGSVFYFTLPKLKDENL